MARLIAALALAAALLPAAASAQCGGLVQKDAHKDVGRGRPPLAVGDSVMRIPADHLARIGFRVNYSDCRGWEAGLDVIREEESHGRLGHLVVMGVGADYPLTIDRIRQALSALGSKHGEKRVLAIVTSREPAAAPDADVVRKAARRYKHRVKVLDWVKKSAGHPEWFISDGFHPDASGAEHYVELLKKALRYAGWPRRGH